MLVNQVAPCIYSVTVPIAEVILTDHIVPVFDCTCPVALKVADDLVFIERALVDLSGLVLDPAVDVVHLKLLSDFDRLFVLHHLLHILFLVTGEVKIAGDARQLLQAFGES